jgi:hypothetical protein
VLAFPVDPKLWSGYGQVAAQSEERVDVANRRVHVRAPAARRVQRDLRSTPGADGWQDPAELEALAGEAAKLTVAAGDTAKTLDLRVKAIR